MLRFVDSLAVLTFLVFCCSCLAEEGHKAFTDAASAGPDFAIQGEYAGELNDADGKKPYGAQVIAYGESTDPKTPGHLFQAVLYTGGLPGAGWEKGQDLERIDGRTIDGVATFEAPKWKATIKEGVMTVADSGGNELGTLQRTVRESETLGAKPPEGALVLFDGSSIDQFDGGSLTDDGLLRPEARSKKSFRDFMLHIEFRTPFMPTATGQARGNSGVYLQDRYEVQVLDSFGLEGKNNECGGIYSVQDPRLNMCYPPLSWQTYDVDFVAARFDDSGNKTKNAVVTIRHNGVPIYESFELPTLTPGGASEEKPGLGPLKLQDHGNPVTYRNIWVVEK